MKETFVELEKAYKEKVERIHHPNLFYVKELRAKRKANGMCEACGTKRITKSQKKRGLTRCYKCRIKRS